MAQSRKSDAQIDEEIIAENERLKTENKQKVRIPLINPNDPDLEIGINGVIKKIKRGVTVELSDSEIEVLEHAGII